MSQRAVFFPCEGGLDETTQAIAVPKGRAIAVRNHESVAQGYARVGGFERYDGHPSPTAAGVGEDDPAAKAALIAAARALITEVPGEGPVRGVWKVGNYVFAWRDNVGATACVMHYSTSTGWVAFNTGYTLPFTSGGPFEVQEADTLTGATSGATVFVRRIIVTSGTWAGADAAGYFIVNKTTGTNVAENMNVGVNPNVCTVAAAPVAQTFPAGGRYEFYNHNFYATTNTRAAYGVNGEGAAFEFDGLNLLFIDQGGAIFAPSHVAVFKQHLFLGYANGLVRFSQPGLPLEFDGALGAGEFGVGDGITNFISNNSNALTILGTNSVNSLLGNDASDFVLEPMTDEAGAVEYTAQRIGVALYLDNRGLRSITATQAYGNFRIGTLTEQVQKTLDRKRALGVVPMASCVVRAKNQYRLFFSDGSGISLFFGRKFAEPMLFDYGQVITCVCTTDEQDEKERIFCGSESGFVYELDIGTSFDGAPIDGYLQLAYNHEGGPWVLKRWHKTVFEMIATPGTNVGLSASYDYGGGEQGGTPTARFEVAGGGGLWDIADWNDFYWSTAIAGQAECYLDGMGKNMSPILVTGATDQDGYVVQGATNLFTVRGQGR